MTTPERPPVPPTRTTQARNAPMAVTAGLVLLGLALVVVGVVYLADTAADLPSFFPGHQAGSTHHHAKHGIAAFVLALLCWGGAWFSTGPRAAAKTTSTPTAG